MELLVVIAITAVLCAMLFPALSSARERAGTAACMSNVRQIGMMHQLYVNNFGVFCPAWDFDSQWDARFGYGDGGILDEGIGGSAADSTGSRVFACPESSKKLKNIHNSAPKFAGYGYNYLLSFADAMAYPPQWRWVRASQVKRPAGTVLLADSAVPLTYRSKLYAAPTSFLCNTTSGQGGFADFRHQGRCTAVFADGHAALQTKLYSAPVNSKLSSRLGYLSQDDRSYDPFYSSD